MSSPTLFTVAAGACLSGGTQYYCALDANQCASRDTTFVSARQLEQFHKNQPAYSCLSQGLQNKIPVGRCTLPNDENLCTGHKSNCEGCFETSGVCFESRSNKCTLEPTVTTSNEVVLDFATFGACWNPDTSEKHCLWSSDECSSEHTWLTPITTMMEETNNNDENNKVTVNDLCTCDKVLLGACIQGDDFTCAVSAEACDSESSYVSAKQLRDTYEDKIDCRLCAEFDMPKTTELKLLTNDDDDTPSTANQVITSATAEATEYTAPSGACVKDGQYSCVLEKSQCANEEDYVSPRILGLSHGGKPEQSCLGQTNSVPVGKCTLPVDDGICTSHMSNCQGCYETANVCFEGNSADCTLQPTNVEEGDASSGLVNFATFGLCVNTETNDEHCLWSRSECAEEHEWLTPSAYIHHDYHGGSSNKQQTTTTSVADLCTCDKVVIGACVSGQDFICAVSADACDASSQYKSGFELRNEHPDIDCRLCTDFELPKNVMLQLSNTAAAAAVDDDTGDVTIQPPTKYMAASGACVNTNNDIPTTSGKTYVCALEHTQCAEGWDYVSARQLETVPQHQTKPYAVCLDETEVSVPVGQCTLPQDLGVCTSHPSGCQGCFDGKEICFQQDSDSCLLEPKTQPDGTTVNFALFGECFNPDTSETHCLWEKDECAEEHDWRPPSTYLTGGGGDEVDDVCTCEKVVIGACQYGGDSFTCAVSPDACDSESTYLGAKQLRDINPGIDCRLCDDFGLPQNAVLKLAPHAANAADPTQQSSSIDDTTTSAIIQSSSKPQQQQQLQGPQSAPTTTTTTTYIAPSGACVSDSQYWCALEKTQCPHDSVFLSARQLEQMDGSSAVTTCLSSATEVPIGKCTAEQDQGVCTGHQSNCQGCYETSGVCFEGNHDECKLEPTVDEGGFVQFAIFGLCIDQVLGEEHCVWSASECNSAHEWVTPARNLERTHHNVQQYCTCDKVVIGACRFGDNLSQFTCAVSEDACDGDSEYIGAKELRDLDPGIDCRLCESFDALPGMMSGGGGGNTNNFKPHPSNNNNNNNVAGTPFNEFANQATNNNNNNNKPNNNNNPVPAPGGVQNFSPVFNEWNTNNNNWDKRPIINSLPPGKNTINNNNPPQGQVGDKTVPSEHAKTVMNKETKSESASDGDGGTVAAVVISLVVFFVALGFALYKVERKRMRTNRSAENEGLTMEANGSAIMRESSAVGVVPPPTYAFRNKFNFTSFLPGGLGFSARNNNNKKYDEDNFNSINISPHRDVANGDLDHDDELPAIYPVKKKFAMSSISSMLNKEKAALDVVDTSNYSFNSSMNTSSIMSTSSSSSRRKNDSNDAEEELSFDTMNYTPNIETLGYEPMT